MKYSKWVQLPPDNDSKFLYVFTKDKRFYKTFFSLLFIVALQQLAALTVNMADNIMLGTYTELALSGATLVNQIQFTLQQICAGIGMGIVVLASQYWGQQKTEPIKKIISIGVKAGLLVGIIFFLLSYFMPTQILSLFTNDQIVIAEGVKYLKVICWTYLVFAVSNSLMYSLQSVETAAIGTVMSVSTICINVCLNYCLIYGNFGFPELGIVGAAIATLISRAVELVIILVYVFCIDKKLKIRAWELLRFDLTYLKDYIKVSTPIVLSGMLWGIAQAAQTAVLGHISAEVIAANSIAVVIFQIFAVFGMSCANVASVTIGKTIGEGRLNYVKSYAKTMQVIFLLIGVVFGSLMFLMKDVIVSLYTVSDETKALATVFLAILSITTVGTCYEYPVESGIIAGGGNTKYPAIVDNLFMWLFTIPGAFLSAFVFKFPPVVTFFVLKADQLLKCIPNAITCNRYRWVRVLTQENNTDETVVPVKTANIITINREFGSGGREVGKRLADALGYDYYDHEIIQSIVLKSGYDEKYVEKAVDMYDWRSVPISYGNSFAYAANMKSNHMEIMALQKKVLERIAATGKNCVIVGRNADVILNDYKPLKIFICADMDSKIKRCMARKKEEENLSVQEMEDKIKNIDKVRSQSRAWYTDTQWGERSAYHLIVNTSEVVIKNIIPLLADYAKNWFNIEKVSRDGEALK